MRVKHKKTLKQKIIADYRYNTYAFENKSFSTPDFIPVNNLVYANSYPYSYVIRDVLKTTILTIAIIAGQIILFFLLKNHILKIPGIVY